MRSAYVDESGISDAKTDPIVVVAGVIVHTDKQWMPLHKAHEKLVEKYIPLESREGFFFHAKDIWHGSGTVFNRETYAKDRREVLGDLCNLIQEFELPVIWGQTNRHQVKEACKDMAPTEKDVLRAAYMISLTESAVRADRWVTRYASDEFLNFTIAENSDLRKYAAAAMKAVRTRPDIQAMLPGPPISRIIEAPSFMEMAGSPPLQLADTCSFLIKRWNAGHEDVKPYIKSLLPLMLSHVENLEERLVELQQAQQQQ